MYSISFIQLQEIDEFFSEYFKKLKKYVKPSIMIIIIYIYV